MQVALTTIETEQEYILRTPRKMPDKWLAIKIATDYLASINALPIGSMNRSYVLVLPWSKAVEIANRVTGNSWGEDNYFDVYEFWKEQGCQPRYWPGTNKHVEIPLAPPGPWQFQNIPEPTLEQVRQSCLAYMPPELVDMFF